MHSTALLNRLYRGNIYRFLDHFFHLTYFTSHILSQWRFIVTNLKVNYVTVVK